MECNGSSKAAEEDNAELSLQNSSNSVNNAVTSVDTNFEFLKTAVSDESSADNNNQQSTKKRKTAAVRRRSSRIWDHFEVVESSTSRTGYYVTCQHCNWRILYSRGSGSSGCNKHMSSTSCPYFSKITTVVIEGETSFGQSSPVMASSNKGVNSPSPSKGQTQNSGDSDIIRVAVIQMSCSSDKQKNIDKAISMVRTAAEQGAQVVLLQELFEGEYFCQEQSSEYFAWAHEVNLNLDGESVKSSLLCSPGAGAHTVPASVMSCGSSFIDTFAQLAKELHVVLPVSFFEKANNVFYNSVVMLDANGMCLGKYRKSHIPDGPGYQEKFYFAPGDTGFKVFQTTYGRVGVAICWDQWFPEAARSMALQGAELILYPTAIGSEPTSPEYDSSAHWERVMVGHSAANMIPILAANRVGTETFSKSSITFYGSSFITNHFGEVIAKADKSCDCVLMGDVDLSKAKKDRVGWGMFRDRRPDLYSSLLTRDGSTTASSSATIVDII